MISILKYDDFCFFEASKIIAFRVVYKAFNLIFDIFICLKSVNFSFGLDFQLDTKHAAPHVLIFLVL